MLGEGAMGKVVGNDISNHIDWALMSPPNITESPYGDGHTAQRIVNILSSDHSVRNNP